MRAIDLLHMGHENVICCWQVDGLLIDPGPQSCEQTLLEALDGERPRALVLTHIHLDHAGATGALVRRWPDVPVYVHERGAPHVVDPSKLIASASRLYDDMDERWGEIVPVPEGNVRVISDGDRFEGLRVAYTPGHASHHVCFLHEDSGRAFTGDIVGVRIPGSRLTVMPTPPPDIDVEVWQDSISTVEDWRPAALSLTHFGLHEDVDTVIAAARENLASLARDARELDAAAFEERFVADVEARAGDDALLATYRQAAPPELQYGGLERYWRKRAA
jgi:glyoxylase-like metal-dependent hydrolase (beta-lactamase superfamily II)